MFKCRFSKQWNPAKSVLDDGLPSIPFSELSIDTLATSANFDPPKHVPLVQPITHTSTYKLKGVEDFLRLPQESGYLYGRLGNPNCDAVECAINALERGAGTLIFTSGMAAITATFFGLLKAGDHVVCQNPVYSATFDVLSKTLAKFNVEVTWVPAGCDVQVYRDNVKPNTRMLYGETPCNPMMTILDMEEFGKLGQELRPNVLTMVDGTFASPYLQHALKYGIDISVHSCTKYLGGHSDLTAGCLTFKDVQTWKTMKRYQTTFGMQLSPHDASLLLRGIKTIHIRMPRHSENAMKVAEFLESQPQIEWIRYPGLKSHPQHEVAKRQMKAYSGMIAIEVKGGKEGGRTFVESCKLAKLAVSLGGVETLLEHPATMTHGPLIMTDKEREKAGITEGLVRISVGLEDPGDLMRDFAQALAKVNRIEFKWR